MREPVEWPTRDPLSHRVAATPDRTALIDTDDNREWTYRALDTIVDGVTARLDGLLSQTDHPDGDSEPSPVGLVASTRVGFVAAFYASLRSGRPVVPLDTRLPTADLAARLDRVDPALVVCERGTEEAVVAAADAPVASLDGTVTEAVQPLTPASEGASDAVSPARWDRDDTAVVMFTSGTTGEPKGVRLTLGNLVASATASAFRLGADRDDRWLDTLPAFHMGGLAPMIRCPLYGTTLALQAEFDAIETAEILHRYGITGVSLVPTQLKRLLDDGFETPDSLSTVLLGGAPASKALLERALDADVPVYPTYGLTEAASQVATATPEDIETDPETVGQPLVFTDVTVVDEHDEPLPAGESGELVVDGPTITPGYLDNEKTATAFDDRGLHTGDIGYRDEDGRLRVLGRADDTILTGGENVHPETVAGALREHPAVDEVAVVGVEDDEWGQRVAALVVPDGTVTTDDLRAFSRDQLADYEVPKTIETAAILPRTASGTVDREAVRERLRD